jgi:hypothetical protein
MNTDKKLEPAKPEHIQTCLERAANMLHRAKTVNKAQYAHGINSTSASIEWWMERIKTGKQNDYKALNTLHDAVMKLGGYLFSLQEKI